MEGFCRTRIADLGAGDAFVDLVNKLVKDFPIFERPVIEQWPEVRKSYLEVISYPVSLSEVKARLISTSNSYPLVGDFCRDLELIASNCETFNQNDRDFRLEAGRFRQRWMAGVTKVAKLHDHSISADGRTLLRIISRGFLHDTREAPPEDAGRGVPDSREVAALSFMLRGLPPTAFAHVLHLLLRQTGRTADQLGEDISVLFGDVSTAQFWELFDTVQELFSMRKRMGPNDDSAQLAQRM